MEEGEERKGMTRKKEADEMRERESKTKSEEKEVKEKVEAKDMGVYFLNAINESVMSKQ
jgi:hypothetical protein